MRDENCDLNRKAGFSQVICQPIVKEAESNGLGELRGDWSVRGFWAPQRVAVLFFMLTPPHTRAFPWRRSLMFTETRRSNSMLLRLNIEGDHLHQSSPHVRDF